MWYAVEVKHFDKSTFGTRVMTRLLHRECLDEALAPKCSSVSAAHSIVSHCLHLAFSGFF